MTGLLVSTQSKKKTKNCSFGSAAPVMSWNMQAGSVAAQYSAYFSFELTFGQFNTKERSFSGNPHVGCSLGSPLLSLVDYFTTRAGVIGNWQYKGRCNVNTISWSPHSQRTMWTVDYSASRWLLYNKSKAIGNWQLAIGKAILGRCNVNTISFTMGAHDQLANAMIYSSSSNKWNQTIDITFGKAIPYPLVL